MRTLLLAASVTFLTLQPLLVRASGIDPIEFLTGPGWEIEYDLPGEMEVEVCLASCQTELLPQPGGTMSLFLGDPNGDGVFADGAVAYLNTFEFDLEYEAFGQVTTEHISRDGLMGGTFDASTVRVEWYGAFQVKNVGSTFCTPAGLCELATPPTPPNPPTPINDTRSDTLSTLQFDILGGSPPDALALWTLNPDNFPAFVTFGVALRGQETGRRFCNQGLGRESHAFSAPWECIPEPHPGLLVALALVGVAIARARGR